MFIPKLARQRVNAVNTIRGAVTRRVGMGQRCIDALTRISRQLPGNKTPFARSTFQESARLTAPMSATADAQIEGRVMKMFISALVLATVVCAPAFITAAARNTAAEANQSGRNNNGYYRGYPLEDWYRTDSW
jgi:hypothetical protein